MTEKMDENLRALIGTRNGKLAVCTRKMNETRVLFDINPNVDVIRKSFAALKSAMHEFSEAHASAQSTGDHKDKDNTEWYEPKMKDFHIYVDVVEGWMKSESEPLKAHSPTETDQQNEIAPDDSVSKAGSKASKTSSYLLTVRTS